MVRAQVGDVKLFSLHLPDGEWHRADMYVKKERTRCVYSRLLVCFMEARKGGCQKYSPLSPSKGNGAQASKFGRGANLRTAWLHSLFG